MAHRFEVDRFNKIGRMTYFDEVTEEELSSVGRETPARLQAFSPKAVIIDLTGITNVRVTTRAVRTLAQLPGQLPEGIVSVIVASGDFVYGMARMFEMLKNSDDLHVVRTVEEAYLELGVQNPQFEHFDPEI